MATGVTVLDAILAVFMGIAEWIGEAVTALIPMFYVAETGLTFLGVLSVASLGIGMVFLLIGVIQNFLHFRS